VNLKTSSKRKQSQVVKTKKVVRQNAKSDIVPVLIHVTRNQLEAATVLAKDLKLGGPTELLGLRSVESMGPDAEDAYGYDTREYKNFMRKYGD
jgi:hypothetical protein